MSDAEDEDDWTGMQMETQMQMMDDEDAARSAVTHQQ